jgi:ferric-dicitrate binding protein FerR (iron transport regulator)
MLKLSDHKQVALLLQKYIFSQAIGEQLSTEDQETLNEWRGRSPENEALFQSLTDRKQLRADLNEMAYIQSRVGRRWDQLSPLLTDERTIRMNRPYVGLSLSAAACVIGALLIWFLWPQAKSLTAKVAPVHVGHTIGELIYSDGRRVELDSVGVGSVLSEEGTVIKKIDSSTLQYLGGSAGISHTIHTPNGGKYTVILPDGSSVCLNAGSTLKYPTEFGAVSREVRLEGEGFFRVAHQVNAPFVVHTDRVNIEDLATRFDVKSYREDAAEYTTLVSGSIRLLAGEQSQVLQPGEQARSMGSGGFTVTKIDTFATTAWVTGRISFTDQPLSEVMKELCRWYDVTVTYKHKGEIGDPAFGYSTVKSTSALSDVLTHINHMMNLHCSYDEAAKAIVVDR